MNNLKNLEKKYEELGKEIEKLKKEEANYVGFMNDPIFLLSTEEYERYKAKIPPMFCWWWLRSLGYDSNLVAFVNYDGAVPRRGCGVNGNGGVVRPALNISNLKIGKELKPCKPPVFVKNKLVFNGVTWVQIDDGLYISELPIAFRRFDAESNNYENSEIRKFLLDWFEDRLDLN